MTVCSCPLVGQKSIRQVDFKNFTYPLSGSTLGHDRLVWLDSTPTDHIRLKNGKDLSGQSGFSLDSVKFADLTGDGNDEAIVVLHYDTGGTQQTDYIYIYSLDDGKPRLLAYCYTGDRGYSGLNKVYATGGKLVIELFDPEKREGDCCSTGFIRTRYAWRKGKFEVSGPREFGKIEIKVEPYR